MSSKAFSPAANLLRHSRLMAMPAPMPPPPSTSVNAPSSLPYPTAQAIATPQSSAHRGNWGLKRDLPVGVSERTAYIRYQDLDDINHMTTFRSAADNVLTLKKWQEMGVPLSKLTEHDEFATKDYRQHKPVFGSDARPEDYKWRFRGPYLREMNDRQTQRYVKNHVRPRVAEFRQFFARRLNLEKIKAQYDTLGMAVPSEDELAEESRRMGEEDGVDLLELRKNLHMFERLVVEFLDIPAHTRPHLTHPSAGLYYVRSNSWARNDPMHGPQEHAKPIKGRELNRFGNRQAVVGVGGVAAKLELVHFTQRNLRPAAQGRFVVKHYRPLNAHISSRGRLMFEVNEVVELQGGQAAFGPLGTVALQAEPEYGTLYTWNYKPKSTATFSGGGVKPTARSTVRSSDLDREERPGTATDDVLKMLVETFSTKKR